MMTSSSRNGGDDRDRQNDLAHLSSAVGHYLINAFSASVSNAELIRSPATHSGDPKEHAVLATSIIETALSASQVARKLIDWARGTVALELREQGGEPRMVDLNQVVAEVVEAERPKGDGQIEWRVNLGEIARISGDPAQLRAMIMRFAENAREALPPGGGTIEFTTQTDARDWVLLTIRDSGCGMSPEVQRRATEPFFSTKDERAGVGLTIAQVIWRRHRGALSIESRQGEGTTVRLSVWPPPAASVAQPQGESKRDAAAGPAA